MTARVGEGSLGWYRIVKRRKKNILSTFQGEDRSGFLKARSPRGCTSKLPNPCLSSFFFVMTGNVSAKLPPKRFERNMRPTENILISSLIVIGKISRPIAESLVKTDTSSEAFLSTFRLVCDGRLREWSEYDSRFLSLPMRWQIPRQVPPLLSEL
jgi:hypothetical protein